ncbi:MAG: ATP-binding protein [Cyclobacteriaceae bacterium]|nr:ATP-binding protein [Cyclobacteriaceae bacterium]
MEKQVDKFKTNYETKRKIWMIFLIFILIFASISYSSYQSFSTLTQSIQRLSKPNGKMELINETFREIFEAENHIQAFILTGDTLLEQKYLQQIESARYKMSDLKAMLGNDSIQVKRVDSLQTLFETKLKYLGAFLKLKNKKQMSVFTSQALARIKNQLNDSSLLELQMRKGEFLKGYIFPVESEEIVITPDQYRGLNGFIRKIFGGDKTVIDTITTTKEELFFTKEIRVDTSILKDYSPDSTLVQVQRILNQTIRKEKRMQQQLTQKELALLHQDQVFISNIRTIIDQLRKEEKTESTQGNRDAREIATRATQFILLTGLAGFFMSGVFLFFILRDITRSYYYRKQLEKEKAHVEELAQVKEKFLSNMSHEIRTPLQSIQGFSELIGLTQLNRKQQEFMNAINYSNTFLSELVDDILDQAKIKAGKLELTSKPFDLRAMVEEMETLFLNFARKKNIVFEASLTGNLKSVWLMGDALQLKRIFTNLLSNAIKFTEKGKVTLVVSATRISELIKLEIIVNDTGIGISKKAQTSIFDEFTQDTSSLAKSQGTGLGLSITKSLIKAMGGDISVKSRLGDGSTFTAMLELPYVESNKKELANKSIKPENKPLNASIMIVEDDEWNAKLLEEILLKSVKNVQVFKNAEEALLFLKEAHQSVNLILTDIKMPGMDGSAFLKEVRLMKIKIPVVALTAHIQPQKLKILLKEGFDRVCSKPYKIADIQEILDHSFKRTKVAEQKPALTQNSIRNSSLFDFSIIRKFAGDDEAVFRKMLADLTINNERQVNDFGKLLADDAAINSLVDLSHQIKTTYDYLGLYTISETLGSIELHHQLGNLERVVECAQELYPQMQSVLKKLKDASIN